MDSLYMAWTTVESQADAERLASGMIDAKLAACVQIEGPITSCYRWQGKMEKSTEWRLLCKIPAPRLDAIETWILQNHPYETPQWIVVEATHVSPGYLHWATLESSESKSE